MKTTLNCGNCFKDTTVSVEELKEISEKGEKGNLNCKCGHPLIKDGMISLR